MLLSLIFLSPSLLPKEAWPKSSLSLYEADTIDMDAPT